MKVCYKCKIEKSFECFSKNSYRSDGLSSQCKECHKSYRRNHYLKNKNKVRQQVSNWRNEYKQWFYSLKNKPCKDCNKSFPYYCMDFDHFEDNKEFDISQAFVNGWSKTRILKEIEKCDLICAICHRIRTHKRNFAGVV